MSRQQAHIRTYICRRRRVVCPDSPNRLQEVSRSRSAVELNLDLGCRPRYEQKGRLDRHMSVDRCSAFIRRFCQNPKRVVGGKHTTQSCMCVCVCVCSSDWVALSIKIELRCSFDCTVLWFLPLMTTPRSCDIGRF